MLERYVEGPTGVMREEHRMLKRELKKLQAAMAKINPTRPTVASLTVVRSRAQVGHPEIREPHPQ